MDGSIAQTRSISFAFGRSSAAVLHVGSSGGPNNPLFGCLSDLRIYGRTLFAAEVAAIAAPSAVASASSTFPVIPFAPDAGARVEFFLTLAVRDAVVATAAFASQSTLETFGSVVASGFSNQIFGLLCQFEPPPRAVVVESAVVAGNPSRGANGTAFLVLAAYMAAFAPLWTPNCSLFAAYYSGNIQTPPQLNTLAFAVYDQFSSPICGQPRGPAIGGSVRYDVVYNSAIASIFGMTATELDEGLCLTGSPVALSGSLSTCAANTYTYSGASCASCAASATFLSASAGCAPSSAPTDTAFYLSGTLAEGVAALTLTGAAPTFVADHNGAAGGALALAGSSNISVPGAGAPTSLPTGGSAWSMAAWISCAADAPFPQTVVEWGGQSGQLDSASLSVGVPVPPPNSGIVSLGHGVGPGLQLSGVAVVQSSGDIVVSSPFQVNILSGQSSSTLAGSASSFADGAGGGFVNPTAIATDPSTGNVIVADNSRLRVVTMQGVISTLAGSGVNDFADGPGTSAHFFNIYGVGVIPSSGAIAVADQGNNRVRLVSPLGVVSTLAGNGGGANTDAVGTSARFQVLLSLAVVPSTEVIVVADLNNIRLVSLMGVVRTLAGCGTSGPLFSDGIGSNACFHGPSALSVFPSSGVIIVADNCRLRLVTPLGAVTTFAGGGGCGTADGTGTAASFSNQVSGLAVTADGTVLVADPTRGGSLRTVTSPSVLPVAPPATCDSTWHHAALIYTPLPSAAALVLFVFVDGALVSWLSSAAIALPASASSMLRIGWSGYQNTGTIFSGALSDLRIYARALSASEVVRLAARTCGAGSYSYGGSGCSPCAPGSAFIVSSGGCAPPTPPVDAIFYLSGSSAEGFAGLPLTGAAPTFVEDHSGAVGGALQLTSGSFFSLGTPASMLALFNYSSSSSTVSAWVKCASSSSQIVAQFAVPGTASSGSCFGMGLALAVGGGGSTALNEDGTFSNFYGAFPTCNGTWHHLAIVKDPAYTSGISSGGSPMRFYVDGVFRYSANFFVGCRFQEPPVFVVGWNGQVAAGPGQPFAGALSDLRIYARALSASEVVGLASASAYSAAQPSPSPSPLLAPPSASAAPGTASVFGAVQLAGASLAGAPAPAATVTTLGGCLQRAFSAVTSGAFQVVVTRVADGASGGLLYGVSASNANASGGARRLSGTASWVIIFSTLVLNSGSSPPQAALANITAALTPGSALSVAYAAAVLAQVDASGIAALAGVTSVTIITIPASQSNPSSAGSFPSIALIAGASAGAAVVIALVAFGYHRCVIVPRRRTAAKIAPAGGADDGSKGNSVAVVAGAADVAASALGSARGAVGAALLGGAAGALELAAPAVPIIGAALSAIAALLRQVEAMRTSAEASRHLAARLERLRSLTRRAGEDEDFVAEHTGIFEGLLATLRRAERALTKINERSRLTSFALSSGDVERIAAVDKALTLHVAELSAALQAETLSAVRDLHAAASARDAGLGAAIAEAMQQQQLQSSSPSLLRSPSLDEAPRPTLPPFNMTFRLADLLFDPPLEMQERTAPRGSFGIVVFATWRAHALPCAVKMIPARTALGAQALSFMAWMGEAELMRRLREHRAAGDEAAAGDRGRRHVVNIFGIGVHEDAKSGEPERCECRTREAFARRWPERP